MIQRIASTTDLPLPGPLNDFWYLPVSGGSQSGRKVTPESAMGASAVFACVKVIAETLASLPLITYRRLPSGGKERAPDNPLYGLLATRPNSFQTSFEWREMMFGHVLLRGNAYSLIVPGPRGFADQLLPIHPDRVKVDRMKNGELIYHVKRADQVSYDDYTDAEMFHLKGLSTDGVTGISVIGAAKESIGLSLATEEYGARFFSQNASPKGILTHPGRLSDEAITRLRNSWMDRMSGLENAHKPAVLEEGMSWQSIGMTNDDAQFLMTRRFQIEEIARFFRMPHHKIGMMERSTFSNIESQSIEFVTDTIRPWAVRFEQVVSRDLILAPQVYFVEFLIDGILRGDTLSRYQAYQMARSAGWINGNEIREKENMNPVDGLDEYWVPLNNTFASAPSLPPSQQNPQEPQASGQLRLLANEAAGRLVRKELSALRKAAVRYASDQVAWESWLGDFYTKLEGEIVETLRIDPRQAHEYVVDEHNLIALSGLGDIEARESEKIDALVARMLEAVS